MTESNHWAKVPRKVIVQRMETAECLDDKVFWAIILWSWCGPETCEYVVKKNRKGFIERDEDEQPIPALQKDLLELLGLAPGMKGHISRSIQRLTAQNSICIEAGKVYPVKEPARVQPTGHENGVASTGNWNIANRVVSTGNLPTDPAKREAAVLWLDDLSTRWCTALKDVRTGFRNELVLGLGEHGIIIVLKKLNREEKKGSAAVAAMTAGAATNGTSNQPSVFSSNSKTQNRKPERKLSWKEQRDEKVLRLMREMRGEA